MKQESSISYQVLARKYRPANFKELKGQEALVQVITNAIKQNKIAHAYLLTGIRGVGKTTTARIIAKTINCTNLDLTANALIPCGKCDNCIAIQNSNHPDIIELDAASKTGVGDIREVIEATKFKSLLGKYKTYIIDEIHMLSNNAFNALLKTLEEPPEHLIFIFATTEFRKLPLTIISRCQKFDLHRFTIQDITKHIEEICEKEQIKASHEGLKLIAKFSEGSMRDTLSLLETMNMYKPHDVDITVELVNKVLGLPDISQNYKLLNFIMTGNPKDAISITKEMYNKGTEASVILEELLQLCSKITKYLAIIDFIEHSDISDYEKSLLENTAKKTDIENITSIWKMLFKGIEELKYTHNSLDTLEVLIIRICHISTLPPIEKIIQNLTINSSHGDRKSQQNQIKLTNFKDVVNLFYKNKELVLYYQLVEEVNLIDYKNGRIEAKVSDELSKDFTNQIITKLNEWTGITWQFIISNNPSTSFQTIKDQEESSIENNKLVKEILESFPGAKIKNIVKIT